MRASLSSFLPAASLFLALASACGGNTTQVSCDPSCGANEICDDGVCKSTGGNDAGPTGCTSDSQCAPGVCDSTTHACVASECDPTCPAWDTCSGRTCELSSGKCNSNSDCSASLPICDSTHTCVAPTLTQPATPAYQAVIITNAAYAPEFTQIAQLHTLTGVPAKVETVEEICAAEPAGCSTTDLCNDTPKAIKDYISAQYALGIRQVVLGGDASIVPSRLTHAQYDNPVYPPAFDEYFYSDDYYGDLTEWDTNHDCLYGEDSMGDTPGYIPSLGVTRISVSSPAELATYFAKEQAYLTSYDTSRIDTALFMSNVATDITVPVINDTIPIDAALYFEYPGRTLAQMPSTFQITKLYSSLGGTWPNSQPLNDANEQAAFVAGTNLAVHSGHGDETDITVEQDGSNEFTGDQAYALQNSQFPILISCACEAATFSDGDTCAGQQFITAPMGGGVGYLGNSTIGLGIAGGMQLLDQFLKYSFSQSNPIVGDAVMQAHINMPTSDGLTINVPVFGPTLIPVVDITSWRWTQKAATYLGDGLLPIYTDVATAAAPAVTATRTVLGNYSTYNFTVAAGPVGTLMVAIDNNLYQLPISGSGAAATMTIAGSETAVSYGFSSATTLAAYAQATLN